MFVQFFKVFLSSYVLLQKIQKVKKNKYLKAKNKSSVN